MEGTVEAVAEALCSVPYGFRLVLGLQPKLPKLHSSWLNTPAVLSSRIILSWRVITFDPATVNNSMREGDQ